MVSIIIMMAPPMFEQTTGRALLLKSLPQQALTVTLAGRVKM